MIAARHIRHFRARYHRNGIGGTGFFACHFDWLEGNRLKPMQAIIFPDPGSCAVTEPGNIVNRYRGDDFEHVLRQALVTYEEKSPGALYAHDA